MERKYLIVSCSELGDQWECDADREPVTMVSDWKAWYNREKPDYRFEVWEFDGKSFKRIKDYDEALEEGMILLKVSDESDANDKDSYTIVKRFPKIDRDSLLPHEVLKLFENREPCKYGEDLSDLRSCGSMTFRHKGQDYAYTEYADNQISSWY